MSFKDSEIKRYRIEKGDVIICEGGEPGRATVWENENSILYQKALHRVRTFKGIDPWLLVFQLWHDSRSGLLEKYFTGTTIKHFTGRSLQQYPVCVPPANEQIRIVKIIKTAFNQIKKLYEIVDELQNQSSSIENTILSKAFGGKLVPQDPNDESASILIERIQQEKARQADVNKAKKTNSVRKRRMKSLTLESVKATINQMENNTFSFDDLRQQISGDYESLKNIIFELLESRDPFIKQIFDQHTETICFFRGNK